MTWEKDIRFPAKKVDDSWKEQIHKESQPSSAAKKSDPASQDSQKASTLKPFVNLISSLGFQALMHLGEIAAPETAVPEVNLQAAKEIIDLLAALKVKTESHRSAEESQLLLSLLSELQMKFSQKV